jgi:hypothetical protein
MTKKELEFLKYEEQHNGKIFLILIPIALVIIVILLYGVLFKLFGLI